MPVPIDSTRPGKESRETDPDAFSMRGLRDGDPQALQHILDRHWQELVRFGASQIKDADVAEDLAQEAFLALWRKREEWDFGGTVKAFLFRVVRNNVAKRARRKEVRLRLRPRILENFQRATPSPHDDLVESRRLRTLDRALEGLPPRRREVLELARFHGLSHAEIAATMSLSTQTVANHISLALRDLRRVMDGAKGPEQGASGG